MEERGGRMVDLGTSLTTTLSWTADGGQHVSQQRGLEGEEASGRPMHVIVVARSGGAERDGRSVAVQPFLRLIGVFQDRYQLDEIDMVPGEFCVHKLDCLVLTEVSSDSAIVFDR